MVRKAAVVLALLTASAVSARTPILFDTFASSSSSRASEAIFYGATSEPIAAKIASYCMDRGWPISQQTPSQVVCDGDADSLVMMFGPRYASYKGVVRFSLVTINGDVRVQASQHTSQTNAFGQQKDFPASGSRELQAVLITLGGNYPPDTSFDGNDLGARGFVISLGNPTGFKVVALRPGGAAQVGGLLEGDVIGRVGKRRIRDESGMISAMKAFPVGAAIPLEVHRNGGMLNLSIIAAPYSRAAEK